MESGDDPLTFGDTDETDKSEPKSLKHNPSTANVGSSETAMREPKSRREGGREGGRGSNSPFLLCKVHWEPGLPDFVGEVLIQRSRWACVCVCVCVCVCASNFACMQMQV